ncbi:alpha/beta-hydrolase [Polyplosphaeria fusca]|uniref:Alpha/beta-hydrolase n=1 Tax=Polyplosphaeria fusca TaxID=682080 RepID=A0A9P4UUC9_9PLEO|nr:alpha/beta-hydrolase [Polyplosphaeria fusca]
MSTIFSTLFLVLASPILAAPNSYPTNESYPHPANGICIDYTVKEEVTWTKSIWGIPKPKNNFDIAALRISEGALDYDFEPISGYENATSTYQLAGTFCSPSKKVGNKEKTVLLATHGGGYDRRYWASSYMPSKYNFVQYALENGYSVFYYDRLGTGQSQIVSGYESQGANQVELIAKIASSIRSGRYSGSIEASKVVLVGHSLGSVFSAGAIIKYPSIAEGQFAAGATSLTLKAGLSATFQNALLASTVNPPFKRDSGYVVIGDIYAHARSFFSQPFDIPTLEYAQSIVQPASIVEMLSSANVKFDESSYNGSVLLTAGEYDILACGGNCYPRFEYGVQNKTFPVAKPLETYIHPGAGHGVNFANNATGFYATVIDFVNRNI